MSLELHDGRITGSSGVAKAGLTLGIIGTSLAALGGLGWNNGCGGNGILGNILGGWGKGNCGNGCWNNGASNSWLSGYAFANQQTEADQSKIAELDSTIARLQSMRYTDYVGIDLYKNLIAEVREEDKKITDLQGTLFAYLVDLDKRTALNAQASELNRQFDTASRDYMFTILNNKIDCCCEKAAMQAHFDRQTSEMADASIVSYVNSTFIPGTLKLPITSICPEPAVATAA